MQQIETEVLIIGGGLSGLTAAWLLDQAGMDYMLLEGRTRFGGRVLTVGQTQGFDCDLGPSWFWQGQPLIASLLKHFSIPFYEQYSEGQVLVQHADGQVQRFAGPSPMYGSRRIVGGIGRLVNTIAEQLPLERYLLSHSVRSLSLSQDGVSAAVVSDTNPMQLRTRHVALALPPRLASNLSWSPALPAKTSRQLADTPTWMAGHAKFFSIYTQPFWHDAGLCGSAMSRKGPLAEIHDATPNRESAYCLFGFVGLDATTRAQLGSEQLTQMALQQLVSLFGEAAGQPIQTYLQDWSQEELTAIEADQTPQTRHPKYGLQPEWGEAWSGRMALISSETSATNGGLIEGALASGVRYAQRFAPPLLPLADDLSTPHSASMDWDWLATKDQ